MTMHVEGRLVAGSDLLFRSSRRRTNVLQSLAYVPGSAIRGALARRWLDAHGGVLDEEFRRLFEHELRFHHARATIEGQEAFAAPLTLRTEKQRPLAAGATTLDLLVGEPAEDAPRLDRVRGEVTATGVVRASSTPPMLARTRIGTFDADGAAAGVEPSRSAAAQAGLAAEGQLFTEVRLAAGTEFLVRISGSDGAVAKLAEILAPDTDVLTVGRSRTVMGFATVEWRDPAPLAPSPVADGDDHTILALSDLVLLDRFQRHVTALDRDALADMLGVAAADVTVLPGGQQRTVDVGGWDGANGMPSAIDHAVRAGSTVRFRAPRDAVDHLARDPWVGWRNREGHGWVAIDWPGHHADFRREALPAPEKLRTDGPDGQQLADAAERAVRILDDRTQGRVTPTVWNQLEDAVRRGADLTERGPRPDAGTRDAQSASGRGAGSGERRRHIRETMVEVTLGAFAGRLTDGGRTVADLGWKDLDAAARVSLVEHMGREVRLRELQRRAAAARAREYGVHNWPSEGQR